MKEGFETIDIWRTTYTHILPGHEHVVDWMKGAALTPYLSLLDEEMSEAFLVEYLQKIELAYQKQRDGNVLFEFPRLFIVGYKQL